eukprot:3632404-Rhodomonas_salina.2
MHAHIHCARRKEPHILAVDVFSNCVGRCSLGTAHLVEVYLKKFEEQRQDALQWEFADGPCAPKP